MPNSESITVYHLREEMLEKWGFHVVCISTPYPLHNQHVLKVLERMQNVLFENPATMNRAQYEKLIQIASPRMSLSCPLAKFLILDSPLKHMRIDFASKCSW